MQPISYSCLISDIQRKTIAKRFYIQTATHFAKINTIFVTFLNTKSKTLYDTQFSPKCWSWYLYINSMTLFVTLRFYLQKFWHVARNKTICVTFLYTKIGTVCVTQCFIFIFNWYFFMQKTIHFAINFHMQKQCTLRYVFVCKKQCLLRYFFKRKKSTLHYVLYLNFIL